MSKINSEVKARRSTKSLVLGRAKVMSYKELKEARAKRAAKEEAAASKTKSDHARKNTALEVGRSKPKTKVSRIRAKPEPWKAQ